MPRTACNAVAIAIPTRALGDRLDGEGPALGKELRRCGLAAVLHAHVVEDDALELVGDAVTLQRDGLLPVDEHWRHRGLAGAGKRDPDVREPGLAGAVDDAAHHSDVHRLDARI